MAVKNFLLAGTTAGATLTVAGGNGDDAMVANTMAGAGLAGATIVAVAAASTGRGVRVNAAAADTVRLYHGTPAPGAKTARLCDYVTLNAAMAANTTTEVYYLVEDGTFAQALTIRINAAGRVEVVNRAGAVAATMTTVLAVGTRYRIEVSATLAATPSATNGAATVALYTGNSTTALETYNSSTLNLGGAAGFIRWQRFKMSTLSTFDATFDTMRDEIGTEGALLGPYNAATLVVNVTLSPSTGPVPRTDGTNGTTATATVSASVGNGNPLTYAVVVNRPDGGVLIDTRGAYQTSPVFTFAPAIPGDHVVTPYAQQAP